MFIQWLTKEAHVLLLLPNLGSCQSKAHPPTPGGGEGQVQRLLLGQEGEGQLTLRRPRLPGAFRRALKDLGRERVSSWTVL